MSCPRLLQCCCLSAAGGLCRLHGRQFHRRRHALPRRVALVAELLPCEVALACLRSSARADDRAGLAAAPLLHGKPSMLSTAWLPGASGTFRLLRAVQHHHFARVLEQSPLFVLLFAVVWSSLAALVSVNGPWRSRFQSQVDPSSCSSVVTSQRRRGGSCMPCEFRCLRYSSVFNCSAGAVLYYQPKKIRLGKNPLCFAACWGKDLGKTIVAKAR